MVPAFFVGQSHDDINQDVRAPLRTAPSRSFTHWCVRTLYPRILTGSFQVTKFGCFPYLLAENYPRSIYSNFSREWFLIRSGDSEHHHHLTAVRRSGARHEIPPRIRR